MSSNRDISDGRVMPGHGTKFGSNRVAPTRDLPSFTVPELRALAEQRGIAINGKRRKDEIIAAIQEAQDGE